jgi:hypothetical protein
VLVALIILFLLRRRANKRKQISAGPAPATVQM